MYTQTDNEHIFDMISANMIPIIWYRKRQKCEVTELFGSILLYCSSLLRGWSVALLLKNSLSKVFSAFLLRTIRLVIFVLASVWKSVRYISMLIHKPFNFIVAGVVFNVLDYMDLLRCGDANMHALLFCLLSWRANRLR